nr:hypothetical protein [Pandoravirus massiliensis]
MAAIASQSTRRLYTTAQSQAQKRKQGSKTPSALMVHAPYPCDAFWRVPDTYEGDIIAMAILGAALLALVCALVCALRVCALLLGRGAHYANRQPAKAPAVVRPCRLDDQTVNYAFEIRACHNAHRDGEVNDSNTDADATKSHDHEKGRECDQEVASYDRAPSWRDKWNPALTDPEGFAAARIRARKEERQAKRTHRARAPTYARPLPLDTLVALERTSARAAALPDPH